MLPYRLLALDLDGTTLNDNKEISFPTKYWVKQAVENGVIVSIATGRGRQTAEAFRKELSLSSPMVFLNGAEIWKTPADLFERHYLKTQDIFRLHRLATQTDSWFWGFTVDRFIRKPDWQDEDVNDRWMKFGLLNNNVTLIKELKLELESWGHLEITQSAENNLEISAKGITKEYGIRKVCSLLDIELENVMAIGDSFNDLQLLTSVGLGVAMENASDEVKRAADKITSSNEKDGVARAICQYIFEIDYREKL
ncbi:Cof-type HAD-IIB family hydrolase [Fredinandcohnia sp. QZ13]|uniref:Cof-type HAD-IIB family hydrolase n=1 Tax=Fredinandcohnia sp. QZ13 TaxID=3073144 RepID=UPI0028533F16|nr:Cof-type HAD-IIB family hydrolase [Fredinandcohnia sp. QZ13]MDR4886715.1 Cof-type HAD-IIB family hydrolase [Fredinandcohnia sp. QZ13]